MVSGNLAADVWEVRRKEGLSVQVSSLLGLRGAPHCPSVFPPVGDLLAHSLPDDPQQYLGTGGSGQRTKQSQVSFFPQRGRFTQQECKTFASWVYHLFYLLLFSAWRLAIHQSTFPTMPYDVVVPLLCPRLRAF